MPVCFWEISDKTCGQLNMEQPRWSWHKRLAPMRQSRGVFRLKPQGGSTSMLSPQKPRGGVLRLARYRPQRLSLLTGRPTR